MVGLFSLEPLLPSTHLRLPSLEPLLPSIHLRREVGDDGGTTFSRTPSPIYPFETPFARSPSPIYPFETPFSRTPSPIYPSLRSEVGVGGFVLLVCCNGVLLSCRAVKLDVLFH